MENPAGPDFEIDGSLEAKNCTVTYKRNGRRLAVATISRDRENLEVEAAMEAELLAAKEERNGR